MEIPLALRSDDVENWMNVLLVVILAAFWAIATLIKAKVKQGQEQEENEKGRQRPAKRPAPGTKWTQRSAPQMGRSYPARRAAGVPGSPQRRRQPMPEAPEQRVTPTAQQQRPGQTLGLTPPAESNLPSLATQREPTLEDELPSLTTTALGAPAQIYEGADQQPQQEQPLIGSLLDYDDPAELRRAILHYEILGKPLSLRDPGEHTIGL